MVVVVVRWRCQDGDEGDVRYERRYTGDRRCYDIGDDTMRDAMKAMHDMNGGAMAMPP